MVKVNIMGKRLTQEERKQIKEAFQGGFTHANMWKSGEIFEDVTVIDPVLCLYPQNILTMTFKKEKNDGQ